VREPKCSVCDDPAAVLAVKELRSQGASIRAVAERLKREKSAIHRHLRHADLPPKPRTRSRDPKTSQTGRRAKAGRCSTCGVSVENPEPSSLLKRAERILWIAETIAAQAQKDDDSRLALMAVDRARASLETMMRATGLIGGDGTTINVAIDARRQLDANLGKLSVDELRALARGEQPAIEGEPC
jgi:hypothetical protein